MLAFGFGAGLPLAFLGLLSREAVLRWRTWLMAGGARAKAAFAVVLVAIGVLVLTGLDKRVRDVYWSTTRRSGSPTSRHGSRS